MIVSGEDRYKGALREMWKYCFPEDTDEFTAFYFDRVYKNGETLIRLENGKPVASLQMIPYYLKTGNIISPAGYISGVMTHPDFRRKGYMAQLLNLSFDVMKKNGYASTFLIPQEKRLIGLYEKFGYESFSCPSSAPSPQREREAGAHGKQPAPLPFTCAEVPEKEYYSLYSRFLAGKTNAVLKTRDQFACILWDFFQEGGVLFAAETGMAFTLKTGRQVILKEFFYRGEETRQVFLNAIREYYGHPEPTLSVRAAGRRGMIKPLDDSKKTLTSIYMNMMLD